MNRINTATGELITLTQIKRLLNQSIPATADLSAQGFPFVIDDPQPEVTATQTVTLGAPYDDNGTWRRSWVVTDRPIEDIRAGMSCTPLQGILAMEQAGMGEAYEAWSTSPERTRIEKAFVERAQTWQRLDPVLIAGATALGVTDEQLDTLFEQAITL